MIVIIAGSRTIKDYRWLCEAIVRSGFTITEVVSGKEPNGVDALGERWARENGIPIAPFPADWNRLGHSAGPRRNAQMAQYADSAIILRRPFRMKSDGTDDMFAKMKMCRKPVYREVEGVPHD